MKRLKLNNTITLTGGVGPRGMMGLKGDPGESISLPVAIVSPNTNSEREPVCYVLLLGQWQPKAYGDLDKSRRFPEK